VAPLAGAICVPSDRHWDKMAPARGATTFPLIPERQPMNETSALDMIPISSLNALEYCPRSFYYQVVQGETQVNDFVLEGQLTHQRVHQTGTQSIDG